MVATREKKVPVLVDKPMDFCPGCGHGIISRLIMEALEELDQTENIIFPIGVGCSSNLGAGLECDRLHCCHGRAGAVATGMKRVNPEFAFPVGRILELNAEHEAVKALKNAMTEDPLKAKDYAELLMYQAQIMADLPLDDPFAYTQLVCKLMK